MQTVIFFRDVRTKKLFSIQFLAIQVANLSFKIAFRFVVKLEIEMTAKIVNNLGAVIKAELIAFLVHGGYAEYKSTFV